MKVIYKESGISINAVQGAIDTSYAVSNIQDEYPRHPFISNSAIETLNVSWLNTPDSLFMGHVVAEEVVFHFNEGTTITVPNRIPWHRVFFKGRKKLADDIFISIPAGATGVAIDLKNTFNVADGIDTFSSNGTNGFLSSGGAPAKYIDYPQLRVGTTLVNGTGNYQIREMRGMGLGGDDISLTAGGSSAFTVTKILLPVSVGILRVGYRREFPNPTVGLVMRTEDHGFRKEIAGASHYTARTSAKTYSVPMTLTNETKDLFMATWEGLRGTPVATDLLSGLSPQTVGWMTCTSLPELTIESRRLNYFQTSFEIREVG
jgi:hypothetical protein